MESNKIPIGAELYSTTEEHIVTDSSAVRGVKNNKLSEDVKDLYNSSCKHEVFSKNEYDSLEEKDNSTIYLIY